MVQFWTIFGGATWLHSVKVMLTDRGRFANSSNETSWHLMCAPPWGARIYGEEVSPSCQKHCADLRNEKIQGVTWTRDNRGFVEAFHLDKSHTMTLVAGYVTGDFVTQREPSPPG